MLLPLLYHHNTGHDNAVTMDERLEPIHPIYAIVDLSTLAARLIRLAQGILDQGAKMFIG